MLKLQEEDIKLIESFLDLLNRREQEHCELFDERANLTREQNDLLHELENNPKTKINIVEELTRIRKEYRKTKNKMEFYFPIKEFSKKHKLALMSALKEMKQVGEYQKNRKTTPRIRTDLGIQTTGGRKPKRFKKY